MDPNLNQNLPKKHIFGIWGIFCLIKNLKKDFRTFSENIRFSKHFGIKNVKSEKKIRSKWFLENIKWYRLFLQEITKFSEIPKNIIKGSISHSELNFCSTLTFLVSNFLENPIFLEKSKKIHFGGISGPKMYSNLTQISISLFTWSPLLLRLQISYNPTHYIVKNTFLLID